MTLRIDCDATHSPGLPSRTCSSDTVSVYHGMATPATACGFHAAHHMRHVAEGRRAREAAQEAL